MTYEDKESLGFLVTIAFLLFIAIGGASLFNTNKRASISEEKKEWNDPNVKNRTYDKEFNVVCYTYDRGISCVQLQKR